MLAGGLAVRRAKLSLLLGVWSVATLTAALTGLIAGLVDHTVAPGMRILDLPVPPGTPTGDVLALQAATMGLLGAVLGWLPGATAAIGYSVRRTVAEPAPAPAATEPLPVRTPATETHTLDLAGLESLRKARRRGLDSGSTLPDAATSSFFAAE